MNGRLPRLAKDTITATAQLIPFYQDVQAHYDLSNDFYRLFLGPTMLRDQRRDEVGKLGSAPLNEP